MRRAEARRVGLAHRAAWWAMPTLLVLAALALAQPADPTGRGVRRGMTTAEVKQLLGPAPRISRQILFRRHIEQWIYDDPPARVEFNCVRGEEPVVRAVMRK